MRDKAIWARIVQAVVRAVKYCAHARPLRADDTATLLDKTVVSATRTRRTPRRTKPKPTQCTSVSAVCNRVCVGSGGVVIISRVHAYA